MVTTWESLGEINNPVLHLVLRIFTSVLPLSLCSTSYSAILAAVQSVLSVPPLFLHILFGILRVDNSVDPDQLASSEASIYSIL